MGSTSESARRARETAIVARLGAPGVGMAHPGLVRAVGPDAARFLHSQITNDVEGLSPGAGCLAARVERTGHLRTVFSVHRHPGDDTAFWMLLPAVDAPTLLEDLDAFLFADDVALAVDDGLTWLAIQGPLAAEIAEDVFGPLGFEPWATLPEHGIRGLRRTRKSVGVAVPEGTVALRRSLGGDVGYLIGVPGDATALHDALAAAATAREALALDTEAFSDALEVLRIEAGIPRIGPETEAKRRLLPETGLEQQAVSYTKGCYLGQEVIARVRTYGSVPFLLRALVLDASADVGVFPELGADLLHAETGKKVGAIASRTWSPVAGAPVALAYLDRKHRTPDTVLPLLDADGGRFDARVALLPLYSAPDSAARVQLLYDRAIRTFADGDEDAAIGLLEEALRLDPGFADAYEAIGVMLGRRERFHEAIDVFRRLEEVAPDEAMVNTNLSLYYMKLGDKETAEDEAGKATLKTMNAARGKGGADVDADLERSKVRDATRKKAMFSQVLEFDPVDPIALFGMGNAQLVLGEFAEAADHLARALEVDAQNSPVYAARGKALEKLDRYDEAIAVYKAGVEVASRKGDLMPLKEMQHRLMLLGR